jgi:uncharacterized membrane protein YcaP (DUF421 family)
MDSVMRAAAIYVLLLILFRFLGKRSLGQITTFDFVLLLIISEATQQAMLGEDNSFTNGLVVIVTLMFIDVMLALIKQRFPTVEKIIDSVPTILVENGKPFKDRMERVCVDEHDILSAARERQGLENMQQIKYAVLERDGKISIIPAESARA